MNLGVLPAPFDFSTAPNVLASDFEFGEETRKTNFVLASTAVSGLAAAEENHDSLKVAKETSVVDRCDRRLGCG